jgi:hypothetical protein
MMWGFSAVTQGLADKGFYHLKQSAWLWSTSFKNKLISLGFKQSDADETVSFDQQTAVKLAVENEDGEVWETKSCDIAFVSSEQNRYVGV